MSVEFGVADISHSREIESFVGFCNDFESTIRFPTENRRTETDNDWRKQARLELGRSRLICLVRIR